MLKEHRIEIKEKESLVKKATHMSLKQCFQNQAKEVEKRKKLEMDKLLASLIQKDVVWEALARLIVARNLPYEAVEWAELRSLLILINPTVETALINSH